MGVKKNYIQNSAIVQFIIFVVGILYIKKQIHYVPVFMYIIEVSSFALYSCLVLEGRKEMFYLKTYSTHFIYGYMASDIW